MSGSADIFQAEMIDLMEALEYVQAYIDDLIKKVQAILVLNLPNNVKELRHFLGMIQYYRDMWVKRSEILASLSDLVGECGETKTTCKNKVKKKPWHWDSIHHIVFDNVKENITKEMVLLIQTSQSPLRYMLIPIYKQFHYADGDSPYANFSAFLPVCNGESPYAYWDWFLTYQ
jgi:hypothetical protein